MMRIDAARVVLLVVLAIMAGLLVALVVMPPHSEFNPQHRHFAPTVGSGLHLPLDGGR